jgi:pimeloyl-ACP methyl ester carboxylesterase
VHFVKRVLTLAAAVATGAGLLTVGPALGATAPQLTPTVAGAPDTVPSALPWGKCPTKLYPDLKGTTVKCAPLKVPLSYANPTGPKITLELSLAQHTSTSPNAYRGVMLSNPGGPGAPDLDLGPYLQSAVPHGVGDRYDWVSFDPRGVGASKPSLHCQSNYFVAPRKDYTPTSKRILAYWEHRSKAYAKACERKQPALLDNITTEDSARDMDSIRAALGVPQISYYGFSYGTYLGQVYSTLFPTHLKYLVLDSNVDPRHVWYKANLSQDVAFNRNLHIYLKWVAKYHSVYHLGTTQKQVSALYYKTRHALAKHPRGKVGPSEWTDAFSSAAYYRFGWEDVAKAWVAFTKGHYAPMLQQYDQAEGPGNDNEFAVYNAVECSDLKYPSINRVLKDARHYTKKYPFLTWDNTWFNGPCLYWKGKTHHPVTINGKATTSALLIDETKDAATPYEGSLEVRKLYPHSRLIGEPGGATHADSLSGDGCVDNKIAAYLKSGTLPTRKSGNRADTLCKPLPNPHPTASPSSSPSSSAGARSAVAQRPTRFRLPFLFAR